jgi:hypothetical protein
LESLSEFVAPGFEAGIVRESREGAKHFGVEKRMRIGYWRRRGCRSIHLSSHEVAD